MVNYQKFIKYLLSFVIALSPIILINNANATGLNGWTLQNPIAKGASVAYEGVKNVIINGKNVAKTSSALITPVAKDVSKVLVRGVAGVALSFAVEQLLGKVDWVLDPANNSIKYYVESSGSTSSKYLYTHTSFNISSTDSSCERPRFYYSLVDSQTHLKYCADKSNNAVGTMTCGPIQNNTYSLCTYTHDNRNTTYAIDISLNPAYDPDTKQEEKSIPLDVVAQKVIDNAENGNSDAKVATTAAAADIVNDAHNDDAKARPIVNQLEANATTEADNTATGETKPNTSTGGTDLALEFPAFCGWAPTICEAAQTVISFPQTLTDWWNTGRSKVESWAQSVSQSWAEAKEYFTKERDSSNDELDISTPTSPAIDTNVNFSSSCPPNITLASFSYHGFSQNWEVDLSQFCSLLSTYVRPILITMGSFGAVLIVGGVRTNE